MIRLAGFAMVGLDPTFAPNHLAELLDAGVRHFLLPGPLLALPGELSEIVLRIRRTASGKGISRLCVAIGPGSIGSPPLVREPQPLALAALDSISASRKAGQLLGIDAFRAGIDLLITPLMETGYTPKNRAGSLDCFGSDPWRATLLCQAYMQGITAEGVGVCFRGIRIVKGGLVDYVPVPVGSSGMSDPKSSGTPVYAGATAVVMERRITVPATNRTGDLQCTRSLPGLREWRDLSGFGGIVMFSSPDSVQDPGGTLREGIAAGCDLSILTDGSGIMDALDAAEAYAHSPDPDFSVSGLAESGKRLERIASDCCASRPPMKRWHPGIELLRRRVCSSRRDSCVIHRNGGGFTGGAFPWFVLVFLPRESVVPRNVTEGFMKRIRERMDGTRFVETGARPDPDDAIRLSDAVLEIARSGRGVGAAVFTCDAHLSPEQEALARTVGEAFPDYSVVALHDPQDLAFFPSARGLAAVFGISETSADIIADLYEGKLRSDSRMPVPIPVLDA